MGKNKANNKGGNQSKGKNGPNTKKSSQENQTGGAKKKVAPSVDHSNVTLLSSPILTLKVLGILLGRGFKASISFILNNALLIIALISLVAAFLYAPGPHEIVRKLFILTFISTEVQLRTSFTSHLGGLCWASCRVLALGQVCIPLCYILGHIQQKLRWPQTSAITCPRVCLLDGPSTTSRPAPNIQAHPPSLSSTYIQLLSLKLSFGAWARQSENSPLTMWRELVCRLTMFLIIYSIFGW